MSHSMSGLNNVVTRYAGAGQKRLEQFKKRASRSTDLIEQVTFASSVEEGDILHNVSFEQSAPYTPTDSLRHPTEKHLVKETTSCSSS